MKRLLFLVLTLSAGWIEGAAQDYIKNVLIKNETKVQTIKFGFDIICSKYPDETRVGDYLVGTSMVFNDERLGMIKKLGGIWAANNKNPGRPHGETIFTPEENEQLKSGNYFIAIQINPKNSGELLFKILPKNPEQRKEGSLQEEGKMSASVRAPSQGKESEREEVRFLQEQLSEFRESLAAVNSRIRNLEAEVQALKQQLQPGS